MQGWIGVDLDGTLAEYHGWKGILHIGAPIPLMLSRVKSWLKQGIQVKIFTARVSEADPRIRQVIEAWCLQHIGQVLEVTCSKDFYMMELWDDRCVQVEANTGKVAEKYPDPFRVGEADELVKQGIVDSKE